MLGDMVGVVVATGETLVEAGGATVAPDPEPEVGAKLPVSVEKELAAPCDSKDSPFPQPKASMNVTENVAARLRDTQVRERVRNPGVCAGLPISPEG